jgi:hypothetical protein
MRAAVAVGVVAALLVAPGCRAPKVEQRVLFIGNSFVFTNDLPGMFKALAAAKHHRVEVGMAASGGWTLEQHVESPETGAALGREAWTAVVLQEQSVLPAYRVERERRMYPAVRELVRRIRARHAAPLMLSTWARRDGLASPGLASFTLMQAELDEGYRVIAEEVDAAVIPAGAAWAMAREKLPTLDLWSGDGSHPSAAGTYLTACVVFATVFRETPVGLPALAGVGAESARRLQEVAAAVALAPRAP